MGFGYCGLVAMDTVSMQEDSRYLAFDLSFSVWLVPLFVNE